MVGIGQDFEEMFSFINPIACIKGKDIQFTKAGKHANVIKQSLRIYHS